MENLHKNNALALEHMRQAIHNAGGRFYQYRPCRRDASTVYDIENIRHDVVYAQTPLNMNDPFDSMIGFSAEKIYSECTTMVLDAMDLAGANKVVISMLLQYRAFGKMAQLISYIKNIQTYLKSCQKAAHQTMIPLDLYVSKDIQSVYSKAPRDLKAAFNSKEFAVLALLSAKLNPMNISEEAITEMLHIEDLLDKLQQQIEEMQDSKYIPLLRAFLSRITVSCFSASGWNNQLMWSHYANSYTGICVEYDFEKIEDFIGFAHPVSYTTVRPTLSMADLGIAAVDLKSKDRLVKEDVDVERIISYLCCKNKCWQYEDEWRIINIGEENTPQFIKLPCVKSITFGPNVDSLCKRLLLEVCKSKGISCYDLRLNHENYGVERIPITNNGEGWYDGLMSCIPLLQCGHTDGKLHWHDDAYAPMLDTFARNFGHLCLGDPSRNSTGVHEQGVNPEWRPPLRKGVIPTLTIVDGTLENAPEKVEQIIADAKQYAEKYL